MTKVDYTRCSVGELLSAKVGIDPKSANYPHLLNEIERRKEEITAYQNELSTKDFSIAENRVKILGFFQILASLILCFALINSLIQDSPTFLEISLFVLAISLNAAAGITAIQKKYRFYWLSILNQGLQVLSVAIGTISAKYSAIGGVYLYVTLDGSFGMKALFSPGFSFLKYTESIPTQFISIDILAIIFVGAIITVSQNKNTANNSIKDSP
jgi:hypothetical protein